jgi:dolichol-phosphate mannosyltransferase
MNKDLVIIPTYNESVNSTLIYEKIRCTNKDIHILFIDDSSPDNTAEIIKLIQNKDINVFLLERGQKKGIGSAHKEGFIWANKKCYTRVVTIDADLSHNPDLINEMLELLQAKDIIITGRFLDKNSLDEWPIIRRVITHARHYIVQKLFSIPHDTSGAFRCYNFKTIKLQDLIAAKDDGYSFFWESLIILFQLKYKIHEIPMKQPKRIHGSSKIALSDVIKAISYLLYFYIKNLLKKRN